MKVAVLGAGFIGTAIAIDLSKEKDIIVISVDNNRTNLSKLDKYDNIKIIEKDVSGRNNLNAVISECDLVINALPSKMGYSVLKNIIRTGRDVIDITFFEEDPFTLSEPAKQNNVTAVVDCGIAPGMSNLLCGHIVEELDTTDKLRIYVGGVPATKCPPWNYKAVFSPKDVINEYTRPARLVEDGKVVVYEALSDPEQIEFKNYGLFEAFNTDGLRTLITTLPVKEMQEKTIRYPGHMDRIKILKEAGLFNKKEVNINGKLISPLELTSKVLFPQWKMLEGDRDLTLFRIIAEGIKDEKAVKYIYTMVDEFDNESGIHSMARTTGYTATSVFRLLKKGLFKEKGIIPPELIGKNPVCVDFICKEMSKKGIDFTLSIAEK